MTRDEFFKGYESHLGDNTNEIALRDGYEIHYPNGDIYKFQQRLKPGRTPSSWSGSFFADDFEYACTWNGESITV